MYHLYCQGSTIDNYKLVSINPTGVVATNWVDSSRFMTATYKHPYLNLQSFLDHWPFATFITETSDPSTLLQTHPELFL